MIARLLARYYFYKLRWTRLRRCMANPPEWVTLDIGAGDSPFAPADVVCEKFPWDDRERTAPFRHDRPLVVGDIEALPFKDKAFDFVFCSHVLEHTFDPSKAIQELMRVSRAGYIEVPSSYLEKTCHSTASHLWFVRQDKGQLIFSPKSQGIIDPEIDYHFRTHLLDKDPLYTAFHYAHFYDFFNIGFAWKGTIPHRVEKPSAAPAQTQSFDKGLVSWDHSDTPTASVPQRVPWIKKWVHRRAQKAKPDFSLQQILACPLCKHPFAGSQTPASLRCDPCGRSFPLQGSVPVLLPEAASAS